MFHGGCKRHLGCLAHAFRRHCIHAVSHIQRLTRFPFNRGHLTRFPVTGGDRKFRLGQMAAGNPRAWRCTLPESGRELKQFADICYRF